MFKTLVFRWHSNFQDGFNNLKDDSRPGQPKTVITNANIAAVAGLIKQDSRLPVKNIAHSVGISSGTAHKILTQQLKHRKVCTRCAPNRKDTCMKMPIYFSKKCLNCDNSRLSDLLTVDETWIYEEFLAIRRAISLNETFVLFC